MKILNQYNRYIIDDHNQPILVKDLGMRFPTEASKKRKRFGLYLCGCGKEFTAQFHAVKSGNTSSCGCHKVQSTIFRSTKHGNSKHKIYRTWQGIKDRCNNKNNDSYCNYGGRGISVSKEWESDFESFLAWSLSNGYQESLTIDRIDNDGNYEPSNCRFVDRMVQGRNTRKIQSNNTSGFRGVSLNKHTKKWVSQICVELKNVYLGIYKCKTCAALAYDTYVLENKLEHTRNFQ